ncbi:MAG: hypothetical protein PHP13_03105 [Methanomicrobium sp.]|nr:hypothetical protein [Methanomicrobium sp.]MDD4299955.1 hypothetical protein [Methanomicrobium sp.]
MRKLSVIFLAIVFAALVLAAGCTDSGAVAPQPTQTSGQTASPTPFTEQTAVQSDLVPQPTQEAPSKYLVDVQVDKDIVFGTITATFRGGMGQNFVTDIIVDTYFADGGHETKHLSYENIGDVVEFKGNPNKKDRVKVTVEYAGSLGTYIISDQLVPEKLPQQLS